MLIQNKPQLATTDLRKDALNIVEAGINRVLPTNILKNAVRFNSKEKTLTINQEKFEIKGRMFVVGGGKASGLMAEVLEEIIHPENIEEGIINCLLTKYRTKKIKIHSASHPTPDENGVNGVKKMLALKEKHNINKDDIIIFLISGGGSSLMPYPAEGISLKDKQNMTKLLLESGAEIHEINSIRKHLSKIKGGQFGNFFYPAKVISLIISDVVGDDLDTIASGPTSPDHTTFKDAYNTLKKYKILDKIPSIRKHIEEGEKGKIQDTPKKLDNCTNFIIGNNLVALEAMEKKAEELNYKAFIVTSEQKGNADEIAEQRAKEIVEGKYTGYKAILIGGETTLKLTKDHGTGGRNQHYAAHSMISMKKQPGKWALVSCGTDGQDFIPGIGGAIIDNDSFELCQKKGINIKDHLKNFDSNNLLKKLPNSLIKTTLTGTNVSDVIVYLLK